MPRSSLTLFPGRQLRALNRTPRIPARFSSTQAPPANPAEETLRSEPESQTESVSLLVNVKEEDKQASRTAWRALEERSESDLSSWTMQQQLTQHSTPIRHPRHGIPASI